MKKNHYKISLEIKKHFQEVSQEIIKNLKEGEHTTLSLKAENTLYNRFTQSKVRQTTFVNQAYISISFIVNERSMDAKIDFQKNNIEKIKKDLLFILKKFRSDSLKIPKSLAFIIPEKVEEKIEEEFLGEEIPEDINDKILIPVKNVDLAGLLVAGSVMKGIVTSSGTFHWFYSYSFYLDYSIYSKRQRAVKSQYASGKWNQQDYERNVKQAIKNLEYLEKPIQKIAPGKYKTYLAPSAVSEILNIMSWGGLSAQSYMQGLSGMQKIYDKEISLSKKFSLEEDYSQGSSPRFNSFGEVCPRKLSLIKNGVFENFLVSTKTAKEYKQFKSNFSSSSESPQSPVIGCGSLKQKDILKELGTGLYISNLHYLNWSDRPNGRITGMTRFACFWVENAKVQGPIVDLRFDETLFKIFGSNLIDFTKEAEIIPTVTTYDARSIGSASVPGALINNFNYNL